MNEILALEREFDRIGALLAIEPDATTARAEKVSGWSVAEQVDHMLKVVLAQVDRLAERRPVKRGINLVGRIVLLRGRIPRGVGKSPERVLPAPRPRAELVEQLAAARGRLAALAADAELRADPRPLAPHPYFGGLTPRQALRFLAIHTDHHLRIVADIRRAAG